MRFTDYIGIALRNIWRQKLRSVLTIFAVVIGATSVTIMLALVTGIKDFFYSQFQASGQLQQVAVTPQSDLDYEQAQHGGQGGNCGGCTKLTDDMAKTISGYQHVTGLAKTTQVYVFDSASYNNKKLRIQGTEAYEPNGVIKHDMVAGHDFTEDDKEGSVIITQNYADKWGFKGNYSALIGKEITLTTNNFFTGEGAVLPDPVAQWEKCGHGGCDGPDSQQQQAPTELKAKVVGVEASLDNPTIYFPLKWASGLLENQRYEMTKADQDTYNQANNAWNRNGRVGAAPIPHFTLVKESQLITNGYTSFVVQVDDTSNTEAVATQIRKLKVGAVTAQSFIQTQLQVFRIVSYVLGGIGGIALLVAAIGVVNTMIMAILERTREIGVMRAVGAKKSTVSNLFTIEAALLGFWGGVFGVLAGYGLTRLANILINHQLASNSVKASNIIGLPLWLIAAVIGITTIIGMLAGLYPAHRAAKLNPVDALRYE